MRTVWHCDHPVVEEGACYFAYRWFVTVCCSLCAVRRNLAQFICLLCLLVPLVGYTVRLWLFLDILVTILLSLYINKIAQEISQSDRRVRELN